MHPDFDIDGRVAIITGAGQGIGRAYARYFAEAGATTVVAELDPAKGEAVAREIVKAGGKAKAIPTDVADWRSVDNMAKATLDAFGRIDILINNAGLFTQVTRGVFDTLPLEEWDRVMQVNVTGSFLCARAVVGAMRKAGWGRIINISSATVGMGRPNLLHYVTSKAAVVGMTRSMARELGPDGITVNALMPGLTKTEVDFASDAVFRSIVELQAIKRSETPDDLAKVLLFLASPASGFITGQCIAVDGGTIHL
ncbi:MAG TPA: 3-oxoacyl-ACP reductase family protein [Alphaproteobacteria bacterium]|jgi:3-oxoacyl-[acyl-carrier protein] reductase|nr:3-oxoacyl-ACP reductase family protein [Alphaproteobacteria bacterium]